MTRQIGRLMQIGRLRRDLKRERSARLAGLERGVAVLLSESKELVELLARSGADDAPLARSVAQRLRSLSIASAEIDGKLSAAKELVIEAAVKERVAERLVARRYAAERELKERAELEELIAAIRPTVCSS